jgi:LytS/YehU family sensor histidine kinase
MRIAIATDCWRPQVDGITRTLEATARELHGKLIVDVIDDGRGLQGTWGGGVGLANIRSRLASEFGSQAQLTLVERAEGGVIATVEIPLARMPMAEAA